MLRALCCSDGFNPGSRQRRPCPTVVIRGIAEGDGWVGEQESIVKEIATPRGWYRTYDKFVSGDNVNQQLQSR